MASLKVLRQSKLLFRAAQAKDKENIIHFLNTHFAKEEPCARALKFSPEISRGIFSTTVARCLNFPFSTVVFEESGDVAACLLASVWNRTDPIENADFDSSGLPENLRLFIQFLNSAHLNFWEIVPPHVNSVIHREIGSVSPQYTRQGIATRLVTENLTKANVKKYNIKGVLSETTSRANQRVLENSGFKCLRKMPYSDIVDSNGNQVLILDDGTTALHLNYKPIEEYENLPEQ